MSRASARIKNLISESQLSPILFIRILDIPKKGSKTEKESLYLTDCDYDPNYGSRFSVTWFDENDKSMSYIPCGISFEQVAVSTDNTIETSRIKLDNIDRRFSSLAQFYELGEARVHVLRGFRELLAHPDGAQVLFMGTLKKVLIHEHAMEAEVWSSFSLNVRIPRRLYSVGEFPYIPAAKDVRRVYRG